MSSSMVKLAANGVFDDIATLDNFDSFYGIINKEKKDKYESFRRSLVAYANGAYDDRYGRTNAEKLIISRDVSVRSISRANGTAIIELSIQNVVRDIIATIKIMNGGKNGEYSD